MSKDERPIAGRQLLFFDPRSASRLLEVYVKRSLSLNDVGGLKKQQLNCRKWVTPTKRSAQARRASSDSSTYRLSIENILKEPPRSDSTSLPSWLSSRGAEKKTRKTPDASERKSFLRTFFHWFSKKGSETRHNAVASKPEPPSSDLKAEEASKAVRKRHSLRKLSFRSVEKSESPKKPSAFTPDDVVRLPHAVSVEPTSTYLEKVSEELERIVKEVKTIPGRDAAAGHSPAAVEERSPAPESSDDTVGRIIDLLKQHGDAMNEKIQKNMMHVFFQQLSYTSFQHLADLYLSQIPRPAERVPHAAPELVQLAFTLDFTAKVAGLSSQAVSRIMGFGNQYLQDRFTQICSAHNQVDGDVDAQCSSDPE